MPWFSFWTRSGHMGLEAQSHARHRTSGIESDSGRKSGEGPGPGRRRSQVTAGAPDKEAPCPAHQTWRWRLGLSGHPRAELERDTPKALLRGNGQLGSGQCRGRGSFRAGGNAPKAASLSV